MAGNVLEAFLWPTRHLPLPLIQHLRHPHQISECLGLSFTLLHIVASCKFTSWEVASSGSTTWVSAIGETHIEIWPDPASTILANEPKNKRSLCTFLFLLPLSLYLSLTHALFSYTSISVSEPFREINISLKKCFLTSVADSTEVQKPWLSVVSLALWGQGHYTL